MIPERTRASIWIAPAVGTAITALLIVAGCAKRESNPPPASTARAPAAAPVAPSGESVYLEHCAACHMSSGSGVPNFQPSLVDSPIVAGDRTRLENVIRGGSFSLKDRPNPYGTDMPPFGTLNAAEMSALLDYVQTTFAAPQQ